MADTPEPTPLDPRGGSVKLCDPCRSGHHSRCAGEPTFALMCPCHWCKRWADTHGPFSVPEDTKPIEEADRG